MASMMSADLKAMRLIIDMTLIPFHMPMGVWCCEQRAHGSFESLLDDAELNDGFQGVIQRPYFYCPHIYELCLACFTLGPPGSRPSEKAPTDHLSAVFTPYLRILSFAAESGLHLWP